jgi:membrane protein implicated in regulation of membrane protease activity
MLAFWEHLGSFEKVLWFIAVFSSTVLLVQLVLTFLGMGGGHDTDVNHDTGMETHFQLFSMRTLTAFFALFGWVGLACFNAGTPLPVTLGIAAVAGSAAMALVAGLFYGISRLTQDSTFDVQKIVGAQAKVYIPVPASRSGNGKVTVTYGASRELDAVTDGDKLPTGAQVRIKAVVNGSTLLVERL